jgi:putative spermidine/putrescine transport system ATP-binding protein
MARIDLVDLAHSYGGNDAPAESFALKPVTMTWRQGGAYALLGPSGCGKTTLLRMLAGFEQPDTGRVMLDGTDLVGVPPYRRPVNMMFQSYALFPHMTVAGNVAFGLKQDRLPKDEIAARVDEMLGLVQLRPLAERKPDQLSGGQRQRVALARSLAKHPKVLLLDEPLAALDRKLREDMQLEFRRIQQELGVTTINVTHDQREALVMSDRVIVMDHGRIHQDAIPTETYGRPADRFVAGFIGVTNFLPAKLVRLRDDGWAEVRIGGWLLQGRPAGMLQPGAAVEVALRAERISLCAPGGSDVDAEVREVIFEGDRLVYGLHVEALGGVRLLVFDYDRGDFDRGGGAMAAVGERVGLTWRPADLMIFPDDNSVQGEHP